MPPKTVIEKLQSPSPEVTVFKVAGTLGFHEKETLEKLFSECRKRQMNRIVFEVSELTSLGGGCAKIIREQVENGDVVVGMAGANPIVLKFLQNEKDNGGLIAFSALPEAIDSIQSFDAPVAADSDTPFVTESDDDLISEESLDAVLQRGEEEREEAVDVLREIDDAVSENIDTESSQPKPAPAPPTPAVESPSSSTEQSEAERAFVFLFEATEVLKSNRGLADEDFQELRCRAVEVALNRFPEKDNASDLAMNKERDNI
jgi:hypothetical protein